MPSLVRSKIFNRLGQRLSRTNGHGKGSEHAWHLLGQLPFDAAKLCLMPYRYAGKRHRHCYGYADGRQGNKAEDEGKQCITDDYGSHPLPRSPYQALRKGPRARASLATPCGHDDFLAKSVPRIRGV